MADADRSKGDDLALGRALRERPFSFGFYSALRRIECAHRNRPRLGESRRAADDPIRLAQEPSLDFAPSALAGASTGPGNRLRLAVRFLGLFGPNGPLPMHLTEYARERMRNDGDPTFVRFADVFHHRMLSLFYRAWADAQPTVCFDRPDADRFAIYVGSTFGMGMKSAQGRDEVPDLARLHYAGLLTIQSRPADGLRSMLSNFLKLPVEIETFVGHWVDVPEPDRCRLGESLRTGTLGQTLTIGGRFWDCQHKFRVVIGPIGLTDYERVLPGGESFERLAALVRGYVGEELAWDLRPILRREEIPPLQLGGPARLGRTTWLRLHPPATNGDALLLEGSRANT